MIGCFTLLALNAGDVIHRGKGGNYEVIFKGTDRLALQGNLGHTICLFAS
jgi:hypothetical protein